VKHDRMRFTSGCYRCTINTNKPFVISHFQNAQQANTWMGQDGKDASFGMCNDGGYISNMASSYGGMVFSASLWGKITIGKSTL